MKRSLLALFLAVTAAFLMNSTALAADVAQGKVLSMDTATNLLTIEEFDTHKSADHPYGRPTGVTSAYKIEKQTLVGIKPQPGDVVRIAYKTQGTDRIAVRVMNVSKQDLRKK
uniref:DUF5666 domain-containing protein n=1 Tax=Desulfacinum infernum TaxID=35837 RepID=A0A832EII5_9BACT